MKTTMIGIGYDGHAVRMLRDIQKTNLNQSHEQSRQHVKVGDSETRNIKNKGGGRNERNKGLYIDVSI